MRTIICGLTALLLTGCASAAHPAGDQADIAEQVFRSLLGSNASTDLDNRKPVALCFEKETDPDAAFLARFASYGKRVHPCSAGHDGVLRGTRDYPEFQLKSTHKPALQFIVTKIELLDATHAKASASYYEAAESAGGWSFELEKTAAGWVVTKREMGWIS